MIFLTLLFIFVPITLYIYYKIDHESRRFYSHFRRQGIPSLPFVPHAWLLIKFLITRRRDVAEESEIIGNHGRLSSIYVSPDGILFVNDPEYLSDVLKKYGTYYVKWNLLKRQTEPLLGLEGLVVSDGIQHKNARKILSPAFHSIKLKAFAIIMSDVTEQTIDEWLSTVPRKRIRLHHEFSLLTLKILVKTLFGTHYQTLESEIQKTVDTYLKTIDLIYYRNSYYIYLFPWLSKLPICQKSALDKCNKDLLEFVNQIICDRKTKRTDEDDLLNLLLSTNNEFTDKQIREQVLSFITAGHETMTTLLTWAMFVLMTKPTVYEACRTEVDTVLKGEKPKSDQLDKFEILNAVVQETLRMYTPVPIFGRECIQEHSIGPRDGHQIQIPRGATILCNTNTVHRLPNFWRDPEEFDYTRWMKDENGCPPKLAHPCCFLPFSAGSRNCIGQNFALSEATIILATIVQQLNFEIVPEQQIIPDIKLTMKPKYDIYTDIFKRSN